MQIRYLFHSGFLAETETSYYLFDYYRGALPPLLPHKPVTVFASHAHHDHYNPAVFPLLLEAGAQQVYAVLAKDIPQSAYPKQLQTLQAHARRQYTLPGGELLETLLSTDSGVAYVLTTDEGVLYHAGDLNDWTWQGESEQANRQMRGSYRHEIDSLRGRHIDVAFVPLDPRQEAHYADGMLYFLEAVGAKSVYPMHYWEQPDVMRRFLEEQPRYQEILRDTEAAAVKAEQ